MPCRTIPKNWPSFSQATSCLTTLPLKVVQLTLIHLHQDLLQYIMLCKVGTSMPELDTSIRNLGTASG